MCLVVACKTKWNGLRDTFRRELRKSNSVWKFKKKMDFLINHMTTVKCEDNNSEGNKTIDDDYIDYIYVENEPSPPAKKLKISNNICKSNTSIRSSSFEQSRTTYDDKNDSDYLFLRSLLPYLQAVPMKRKMKVRMKLQSVFCDEEMIFKENDKSTDKDISLNCIGSDDK